MIRCRHTPDFLLFYQFSYVYNLNKKKKEKEKIKKKMYLSFQNTPKEAFIFFIDNHCDLKEKRRHPLRRVK